MLKRLANVFTLLVFTAIFLAGVFFGFREYLLLKALNDLKQATTSAILNVSIKASARKTCRGYARRDGVEYHLSPQVTFTSDKSFFSGYVCNHDDKNPRIEVEYKLPPLVRKVSDNAGIVVSEDSKNPGIMVEVLGRRGAVWYEKRVAISSTNKSEIEDKEFDIGPITNCEVYNFVCCDGIGKTPSGRQFLGAVDCDNTCYERCSQEPAILYFTTQPFFESATRNLHIKPNEPVKFSFQVSSNDAADNKKEKELNFFYKLMQSVYNLFTGNTNQEEVKSDVKVILDFGDGNEQDFSSLQGVAEHEYTCGSDNCTYQATLTINTNGYKVAKTDLSNINVIVRKSE